MEILDEDVCVTALLNSITGYRVIPEHPSGMARRVGRPPCTGPHSILVCKKTDPPCSPRKQPGKELTDEQAARLPLQKPRPPGTCLQKLLLPGC
eukprot:4668230-Amphidinium_carterae.2